MEHMDFQHLELLMHIAEQMGFLPTLKTSTQRLAQSLKTSQQTISRKLRALEEFRLIRRQAQHDGVIVSITELGKIQLRELHSRLQYIFKKKETLIGIIQKGMGEGRYYMSLKPYVSEFKKKLGFAPYPGTLNIRVNPFEAQSFMSGLDQIEIKGFTTKERTFGGLHCYKIKVHSAVGAIAVPLRTRHTDDIIEIIAPVYLRGKCKLKDNDSISMHHL